MAKTAELKATGERVLVLDATSTDGGKRYYDCLLPPQDFGHRHRRQRIRDVKLRFPEKEKYPWAG